MNEDRLTEIEDRAVDCLNNMVFRFDEMETSILGSLLSQKMGMELDWEFKGAELVGRIEGNEEDILFWLNQVTDESIEKLGIKDSVTSLRTKLLLAIHHLHQKEKKNV